jgi:hypothetical protein
MPNNSYWEKLYQEYCTVRQANDTAALDHLETRVRIALQSRQDASMDWVVEALQDSERKWFIVWPLQNRTIHLHTRLMAAILWAGIAETDSEGSKAFILPCLRLWGVRRVNEALLEVLEHGEDDEKAGAANALYWAGLSSENYYIPSEEWDDVRTRRRHALLREFIANDDITVRRNIVSLLNLNPNAYPPEMRPLVEEAIRIGRAHPDETIRERITIELRDTGGATAFTLGQEPNHNEA